MNEPRRIEYGCRVEPMSPRACRLNALWKPFSRGGRLAASGARVLQLRSLVVARKPRSQAPRPLAATGQGMRILEEDEQMLEKAPVTGVIHTLDEAVYEVDGAPVADLLEDLAAAAVTVDTIVQIGPHIVFSAPFEDGLACATVLDRLGATWSERDHLGRVTIAGAGMDGDPRIAARAFATLRDLRLEPQFSSASPTRIAFYVSRSDVERVVEALHEAFGLAEKARV